MKSIMVPLMLVLFISNLDQTIVATALPSIGVALHDVGGSGWVATAYLITSAVTTLLFGKIGDMYGRKPVFQVSIAVFLVGSVLCGAATSMVWLVLFRALQGIGGGGLNSLVMAIIGEVVPARQRSKYQASFGIVATVALIAGPFLGGLFADDLSWRWIFYLNIPIGVAALAIVGARLHLRRPSAPTGRVDLAGGLLAAVFTTAVILTCTRQSLVLGVISAAALIAYLLVERRAGEPITPLRLFRISEFAISSAQFLLATLVLFVGLLYVPLFLQTVQHRSAFVAGLFDIPLLVGLILATAVAGPTIAKTGRYKLYPVLGAVLTGGAMWTLSRVGAHTGVVALVVPLVVAGAGLGLFVQVALLAGQNAVEYRNLGVATGALNFFKSVGGAFGASIFGSILVYGLAHGTPTHAFDRVFWWTVPLMALSLVLGVVMREKPLSEEMVDVAQGKVEVPEY